MNVRKKTKNPPLKKGAGDFYIPVGYNIIMKLYIKR